MNRAYHMDCLEAMQAMPDRCFDLAVVDPPYRANNQPTQQMRRNGKMIHFMPPGKEYFQELFRASKQQIIWGGNYFTPFLPANNNWIIWSKNNDGTGFSMAELAWCSINQNTKIFEYRSPCCTDVKIHPTQKPVAVYCWIFSRYAKPGDRILDTHLGSGSSRIAAYDGGLDFTGYEIDADYFQAQEERFAAHTAQGNLFLQESL